MNPNIRRGMLLLSIMIFVTLSAKEKIKVSCIGNSITYGYLLPDPATESYPSQLQEMLGSGYEVGNFGKSGATLLNKGHRPYNKQEEYRKAIDFRGDIAIIHLGINDTDPRNWPNYRDSFVKDYMELIGALKLANNKCRIIIARMTPIADRHSRFESGTRDWHDEIQQAIETVTKHAGVQLIDFHAPLYNYPFLLPDAIHPTKEGAGILAKNVYSAITGDFGGLQLPEVYGDNMVLQRNRQLKIQGIADAGNAVVVTIGNQKYVTRTDINGRWAVTISPLKVGKPYTMTISTDTKKVVYKNILAGEVWLCSGQSNMEFMLKKALTGKADIAKSANENIRLYDMKSRWATNSAEWDITAIDSANHLYYYKATQWEICQPRNAMDFSAIAYYFGKMLQDSLNVPIGLICNAVGGSPIESWIDRSTIEHSFPAILKDWLNNDFIQDWVRKRAALNIKKSTNKYSRHPYEPCYLYESGIIPLESYSIKGVIWYQGESNAHNYQSHEKLFKLLVDSWRKTWNDENLPFYYVQLSSLDRPSWTWFRDSQRRLMNSIHNVGMAISSDYGDSLDVHPRNKKPIGERLARLALNGAYNKSHIIPSGPLFRSASIVCDSVYVNFDYSEGMHSSNGEPLSTFEIAEVDGIYFPAVANVVKNDITGISAIRLYSKQVKHPNYIRYGWTPYTRANLVNKDELPASTFRTCIQTPNLSNISLKSLSGFPKSEKGIEGGVSACYSGSVSGKILMCGGCNFPNKPASEGGSKRYYQNIYVADSDVDSVLNWKKVGKLPAPAAYGLSVSSSDGIICIGGMNNEGSLKSVYRITYDEKTEKASIEVLPDLPFTLDNMSGTQVGNMIYVAGGNRNGKSSNMFLSLDIEAINEGWKELPQFPGIERVQPVCAGQQNGDDLNVYLFGGFSPSASNKEAALALDGYCYSSKTNSWKKVASPVRNDGKQVFLGGGNAVTVNDSIIVCTGGVNKDIFLAALKSPEKDYLLHPVKWYKFNDSILAYNMKSNSWQEIVRTDKTARAGAILIGNNGTYYNICGELKPGIRTTDITRLKIE